MYNLTTLSATENVQDLVVFANSTTDPVSVMGMLSIAVFFIVTMVLLRWGFERAILTSSFISFMLTAMLSWGGMVTMYYPFVFLSMTAFMYLRLVFTGK